MTKQRCGHSFRGKPSGEHSLNLVSHLSDHDMTLDVSISIPRGNRRLTVSMAESLIKSVLYAGQPPDKVVVLIDVDGKDPDQELHPFKTDLPGRLSNGYRRTAFNLRMHSGTLRHGILLMPKD